MSTYSVLPYIEERVEGFLGELAVLSGHECGTYNKEGVDAVGHLLHERLTRLGLQVEVQSDVTLGNTLVARCTGTGTARLLLIGHLDTVYPAGWPAAHPFHIDGERAYGPGTCDMKAGLLAAVYALEALRAAGFTDFAEIAFVLNSDEEIGSPSSRAIIEREARGRDAALVLEAGRENGRIVSARKGMGVFTLRVQGRSAHAGVEPHKGRSAILELAHQSIALHALNDLAPGVTLNVGVVQGGTRSNVVAAEASAEIDLRATDRAGLEAARAAMYACATRTTIPDTMVTIEGTIHHQPLEKTAATVRLLTWCQQAAAEAGFTVEDTATGGGSDGNTTGAMGIPTLDGLGPVGGGTHGPDEYVLIPSIAPRVAMLAGLIVRICQQHEQTPIG